MRQKFKLFAGTKITPGLKELGTKSESWKGLDIIHALVTEKGHVKLILPRWKKSWFLGGWFAGPNVEYVFFFFLKKNTWGNKGTITIRFLWCLSFFFFFLAEYSIMLELKSSVSKSRMNYPHHFNPFFSFEEKKNVSDTPTNIPSFIFDSFENGRKHFLSLFTSLNS